MYRLATIFLVSIHTPSPHGLSVAPFFRIFIGRKMCFLSATKYSLSQRGSTFTACW